MSNQFITFGSERFDQRTEARTRSTHRCIFRRSCSQNRRTVQPARRSWRVFRRSRSRLSATFSLHHALLFFGAEKCCGQPCQKQPSTKMQTLARENTTSALAHVFSASGRTSLRKRRPARCNAARSQISGLVSRDRFACMTRRTALDEADGARERMDLMALQSRRRHPRAWSQLHPRLAWGREESSTSHPPRQCRSRAQSISRSTQATRLSRASEDLGSAF